MGYQVMSHEQIRQKVLALEKQMSQGEEVPPKPLNVLFIEVDGKSYYHTLGAAEQFWDELSEQVYSQYQVTKDTYVVINGDAAPWIRQGVDYFPNALNVYDRFHLKKWLKEALRHHPKHLARAHQAVGHDDLSTLLSEVAQAEAKAYTPEEKQAIASLRCFLLENMEAIRDYRARLREKE
jgi:hypothetical protein